MGSRSDVIAERELECTNIGRHVKEALGELRAAPFATGLLRALRAQPAVSSIVCLGVGRFGVSRAARYQLALALLLRDELLPGQRTEAEDSDCDDCCDHDHGHAHEHEHAHPDEDEAAVPKAQLHVYDPLLSEVELLYARRAGCAIRSANEAGRVHMPGRCLYLLLHCPRALYSNLLESNWGPHKLPHVVVIGNSFGALADVLDPAERASSARWCRVTRAAHLATETACDVLAGGAVVGFEYAFANTSLHTFDAATMPPPEDDLWTRPFALAPEPSNEGLLDDSCLGGHEENPVPVVV